MNLLSLISGGIDSPVATYLFSKKVKNIILLHGDIKPFIGDIENEIFLKIAQHFKNKSFFDSIKTYIVPHGNSIYEYKQNCNNRYTCIFCKRMLLRYGEKIAQNENAEAIIMGDSLGQVASQTLQNIRVIDEAIKIPVFRPLIGKDKEEIVKISKKIGSYDFSILPYESCNAVPIKPCTKAKIKDVKFEESKISVDDLVIKAIKNAKIIK